MAYTDPNPEDFSYEATVAPLKRDFFSELGSAQGMTKRERDLAQDSYLDQMGAVEDKRLAREQKFRSNALLEQRHEINNLTITDARNSAARQREANSQIEDIASDLMGIRKSDATEADKRNRTMEVMIERGGDVANSNTVKGMFDTSISMYDKSIMDADKKRARRMGLVSSFTGNSKGLRALLGDEANTEFGQNLIKASEIKEATTLEAAQAKLNREQKAAQTKAHTKLTEEQRTFKLGQYENWEKQLGNLSRVDNEGGELTLEGKAQLKVILSLMSADGVQGFSDKELNDLSADDSYQKVIQGIKLGRQVYAPQAPTKAAAQTTSNWGR